MYSHEGDKVKAHHGYFDGGSREGPGVEITKDGYWVGEWKNDKITKGAYFREDKIVVEGQFEDEEIADGVIPIKVSGKEGTYKGAIEDGQPEGWGFMVIDGVEYEGNFSEGQMHGIIKVKKGY